MIPDFSRPVSVVHLRDDEPIVHELTASAAECAALAKRFELLRLSRLEAKVELRREDDRVRVVLDVAADVVQACVVTLAPVPASIAEHVEVTFSRRVKPSAGEILIDPLAEDPPEDLVGDTIDLGALVAEYFGLSLEPYPRSPGVEFRAVTTPAEAGPFAALKSLKP